MIIGAHCIFGYLAAFGYGNHDDENFSVNEKISLEEGNNTLDVLSMLIGVQVRTDSFTFPN
jgi:hypothetical protein